MSSGPWNTHTIELGADAVTKRFSHGDSARHAREWRALTLLAAYAPGLAPTPRHSDAEAPTPTIVMSRLAGKPLRGATLDASRTKALAEAVTTLHNCLPVDQLAEVPLRPGQQRQILGHLRAWQAAGRALNASPVVAAALHEGLSWLDASGMEQEPDRGKIPAVFGPGDGNLANYLWDGTQVRVVDFEDSGRSDRAYEIAEITEHVSSWVEGSLNVPMFLGNIDLTPAEADRLADCRRLLALVWLFLLAMDNPDNPRNPLGTAERQARRLLDLLD